MTLYVPPAPPQVYGLDPASQSALEVAWKQWAQKLPRNVERLMYFDGKNKLKDFQIAIPPQLRTQLDVVMGWPEKAVTEPANRTIWDGMLSVDGDHDPLGLEEILFKNRFAVELPMGVRASMAYSCAFISTTPGDVAAGEPEVMIMFHSAMWATGVWDKRRRELSTGLLIHEVDGLGMPTRLTLMRPLETIVCVRGASGKWFMERVVPNLPRRVALEPFPFAPDLDRPFGRSRVDRRVMSITDRAMRVGARLDVHSELFSAMKLFLLGADESTFKDEAGNTVPLWTWYLGRLNSLNRDEEGELPKIEKISAESPEPHIATMRQLASEFSGHTGVPLGSLGIAQDNPESADAKNVAREDIMFMVRQQHAVHTHHMLRTFENTVMIRDRLTEPPAEVRKVEMLWRRPDHASDAALADAGYKQADAADLKGTEVGMRMIGMTPAMIRQAIAEKRRRDAPSVLSQLTGTAEQVSPEQAESEDAVRQAQVVKAKFDALGVGVRAAVDPEDAASRVGLEGIKFTGATPVTLRMPKEDAEELEER